MTSSNIVKAIDAAMKLLHVNKLCYLAEDENAYYMTGCTDDGDVIYDGGVCRVDKKTMKTKRCHYTDESLKTPKKEIAPPPERKSVLIKLKGLD